MLTSVRKVAYADVPLAGRVAGDGRLVLGFGRRPRSHPGLGSKYVWTGVADYVCANWLCGRGARVYAVELS